MSPLDSRLDALLAVLAAALPFVLAGCTDAAPQTHTQPGLELQFASLAAGGCEPHPNGTGRIPDGVTTLSAIIEVHSDSGILTTAPQRIAVSKLESGRWVIGPLKVSDRADVIAFGCDAAGKVIYQGRSNGTAIPEQSDANVRMFLVPVGKLACTGSKTVNTQQGQTHHLGTARSFGAVATMPGGDVLITGGIGDWDGATKKGVGSLDTDVYLHHGGHFRKGPALLEKRLWHHAIALDDGHVLVAGGVSEASAQGALPSPLMAPTKLSDAVPNTAAELVNIVPDAAGSYVATKASPADVGVGALFMSSSLKVGDSIIFAGGIDTDGKAVAKATRLAKLAEVAAGKAGTTTGIDLAMPRIRPALLAFADGTVVVWGGSTVGKSNAAELGEMIEPNGTNVLPIKITTAPKTLLDDQMLMTFGPAVALLSATDSQLVFVVAGGAPRIAPTNATAAVSYLVVLDKKGEAQLKELDLGGVALHAGLGASTVRLASGQALFVGGLIGLSGVAPCDSSAPECLLGTATMLQPPASIDGDKVTLAATSIDLDGRRVGIMTAALPAGALLVGGQSSVVDGAHKGTDALDPTGRVLAGPLQAADEKVICGK